MIENSRKGHTFGPLLRYALQKEKNPVIVGGTMVGLTAKELTEEMHVIADKNESIRRSWHVYLSASEEDEQLLPNDPGSEGLWAIIADEYIEAMGLADRQYVAIVHRDTPHPHVHLIVNRVGVDGRLASDSHDHRRGMAACREIEQRHGLRPVEASRSLSSKRIAREELALAQRTGEPSVRQRIQAAADRAMDGATTMANYAHNLAESGIQLLPTYQQGGAKISGLVYYVASTGEKIKAAELGKRYMTKGLAARGIEYNQERDQVHMGHTLGFTNVRHPLLAAINEVCREDVLTPPPTPNHIAVRVDHVAINVDRVAITNAIVQTRRHRHEQHITSVLRPVRAALATGWAAINRNINFGATEALSLVQGSSRQNQGVDRGPQQPVQESRLACRRGKSTTRVFGGLIRAKRTGRYIDIAQRLVEYCKGIGIITEHVAEDRRLGDVEARRIVEPRTTQAPTLIHRLSNGISQAYSNVKAALTAPSTTAPAAARPQETAQAPREAAESPHEIALPPSEIQAAIAPPQTTPAPSPPQPEIRPQVLRRSAPAPVIEERHAVAPPAPEVQEIVVRAQESSPDPRRHHEAEEVQEDPYMDHGRPRETQPDQTEEEECDHSIGM